jgi:hypothetical protein
MARPPLIAIEQPQPVSVSQTGLLFGALMVAFLIFITTRGDLPKWLGLLGLANSAAPRQAGSFGAFGAATSDAATAQPGYNTPSTPALPALPGIGGDQSGLTNLFGDASGEGGDTSGLLAAAAFF